MMHTTRAVFGLIAIFAAGCGAAPEEESASSQDDAMVAQTIIYALPDGSVAQKTKLVRASVQRAEIAERARWVEQLARGGIGAIRQPLATLVTDPSCAGADLWLFDQTNITGNQLCLYKKVTDDQGWLDLGTVKRGAICSGTLCYIRTWAYAVRSLWAGTDAGALQHCTPTLCYAGPTDNLGFAAWKRINSLAYGGNLNWAYLYE
jgi:hypothetical protein